MSPLDNIAGKLWSDKKGFKIKNPLKIKLKRDLIALHLLSNNLLMNEIPFCGVISNNLRVGFLRW